MHTSQIAKAIRLACVYGTLSTAALSTSVMAVEVDENDEEIERIVTTGSHIPKTEYSNPTPIMVIDQAEMQKFGTPDLASMLAELPAIGSTDTLVGNNNSNANAGLSSADLRRLGSKRTLVLVNGKRHVAGAPGSSQVDLSTIPTALIERIEIITGGASAIYGSDAVSGVVNVIMKKDFEGFLFNATGATSVDDVEYGNHSFNVVAGTSNEKGNVSVYAGVERTKQTMSRDLTQLENWGTIVNPLDTGEDDGIPDRLRVKNVGSEMINKWGVINPFSDSRFTFDDSGNMQAQCVRDGTNSFAFGQFENGCDTAFFTEDYENIYPEVDRVNLGGTFNYELAENVSLYGDIKYTKSEIKQQFQPGFSFGGIAIDVANNAYLSDDARAALGGTGTTSMAKFFDELGNRSAHNNRDLFRFVGGVEGFVTASETEIDYEVYYIYGETNNVRVTENDIIEGNLAAAIDSIVDPNTGEIVCNDYTAGSVDPSGCVPYNPFGYNQASEEAKDWISADVTRQDKITQQVIGASATFDTGEFMNLQGGPVAFATGFEYREETSSSITDELTKSGALAGAATPDENADYDVSEVFIEVSLPLLAGLSFAEELTLDGAYRIANYSHVEDRVDAWKVGLMYAPIDSVRIRATHGSAVRAPNLEEAFSPLSPGFARVSDPCDADNINDDPDRAANCAALGIPVGWEANDNVSIDTLSGGNDQLTPETSTSTTVGMVWQPTFVENLAITVDYYKIEIEDAIISVASQDIADNCVDATGGLDAQYCSAIDRDPTTFDIDLVRSGFLNAAALNTSGVESDISYNLGLEDFALEGDLKFNLFVNKLIELERFEFQDRPDEINVETGEVGDPEWQFRFNTSYTIDDLTVSYGVRYIDNVVTYDVSPGGGSPEDLSPGYIPSLTTHDLSMNYYVSDNINVYAGVRNIFDALPPGYTVNAQYDLIGRRIFGGLNVTF
ncbi:TonB-dependent receptor plug domain-containing protein [Shewanella intestini]|uniref:TonB-dependent receptor n=1 Tax=Shewanella intestini TaxID=2017544 RepID=A0ABS5I545_9GAMM|nr:MULTISPECIES: TonB-dependent receptor [Shewanella]MBR9729150.1 TonB-dependent receptor [Shewanella intestini]MRG37279.1 TonB-dependent receptor [Shewanella sp. XMDDZSB0408]